MTMSEIQARVMFQTVNDMDDIGDFLPHLDGYINAGYDELYFACRGAHPEKMLIDAEDAPELPEWMHPAIADYATWLIYRNGNAVKQQRGMTFLSSFNDYKRRATLAEGRATFKNHLKA